MRVAHTPAEIRRQLNTLRNHKTIAFVPTMGCLHKGHMSLIKEAKALADIVVVSIYVNPLQFGPSEDMEQYPRPFERDAQLCAEAGVDFLFHPTSLYPKSGPKITLKATGLSDCLCGADRPGHFDGVVTVVNILFNIVQPNFAVFGEKDWQQLAIIRRMVSDQYLPIEIIGAEIIRETGGLAMSSRNRYLNERDRQQALSLSRALIAMQELASTGEKDIERLKIRAFEILDIADITPQYLDIRHATSLKRTRKLTAHNNRVFIAAQVGSARLIDNMPLTIPLLETTP